VETRDSETRGHSERVSLLGEVIAEEMGLSEKEITQIRTAGLFHDIGKIGVPDSILLKEGPLTDEEFLQIKKHPAEGEKILSTYSPFSELLPIVRGHHERIDGRGYPDGLSGAELSIGARIIAVADAFDAMVSNRKYRKGLGLERAVEELIRGKDRQFDACIVDAFLGYMDRMGKENFARRFGIPLPEDNGGES